jgi:hypothetical protein
MYQEYLSMRVPNGLLDWEAICQENASIAKTNPFRTTAERHLAEREASNGHCPSKTNPFAALVDDVCQKM